MEPKNNDQQELFDIFVSQGIAMIKKSAPGLNGSKDANTIADVMFTIIDRIETEGSKNGINFPPEVVYSAGKDLMGVLFEAAKIPADENLIKQVTGIVYGKYVSSRMKSGKLTKEQVVQYGKDMEKAGLPKTDQKKIGGQNG